MKKWIKRMWERIFPPEELPVVIYREIPKEEDRDRERTREIYW